MEQDPRLLDEEVLGAMRETQDRALQQADEQHAAEQAAGDRRHAHLDRLRKLQPVLDGFTELMRSQGLPRANDNLAGFESLPVHTFERPKGFWESALSPPTKRNVPRGWRLAYSCKCNPHGLWNGQWWYALLLDGSWWRGGTVGSGGSSIMWGSSDHRLYERVDIRELDGTNFVPLKHAWSIKAEPTEAEADALDAPRPRFLPPKAHHFTFDIACRHTVGFMLASHGLGTPLN